MIHLLLSFVVKLERIRQDDPCKWCNPKDK